MLDIFGNIGIFGVPFIIVYLLCKMTIIFFGIFQRAQNGIPITKSFTGVVFFTV